MARRTVVHLVDDLDGAEIDDGRTVSFAFQGVSYEIDLGAANAHKLEAALDPFIAAGRRVGGRRAVEPSVSASTGSADREQLQAIREWGRQNGFTVSERGRLGKELLEAYRAAHPE